MGKASSTHGKENVILVGNPEGERPLGINRLSITFK
jgi:hypothetical protein